MKKSFADILEGMEKQKTLRARRKVSVWSGHEDIEYISELSLEQCSSGECALHKLEILKDYMIEGKTRVVDLSCGLGVDSWAFSQKAASVVSYERNSELAAATARNMKRLGAENVEIRNEEVSADSSIPECDIIYADPARRSSEGKKVFLLEDCSPDITSLLPMLRLKSSVILLKLSPMADISLLARQLGEGLKEIHIVSLGGEVKELVCLMEKGFTGEYSIFVEEAGRSENFVFKSIEENRCHPAYAAEVQAGEYLIEPCAALLKSGAFKLIAESFGLEKLDASTHLYKGGSPVESSLLKNFRIEECTDFSSSSLKELKKRRLHADVTARNLPVSSDELRKRIAAVSGGNLHIFACPVNGSNKIFICKREA